MKQTLFLTFSLFALCATTACTLNQKQKIDDQYYKRSQSIDWPEEPEIPVPVVQPVVVQTPVVQPVAIAPVAPANLGYTISGVNPETGEPISFSLNMNIDATAIQQAVEQHEASKRK